MLVCVVVARHGLGDGKATPLPCLGALAGSSIEISRKAESKTEMKLRSRHRPYTQVRGSTNFIPYRADERFFTPKEGFSYGLLDPHRKALLGDSNAALLPYGKAWLQQPTLT
jgi:hypothetical protein